MERGPPARLLRLSLCGMELDASEPGRLLGELEQRLRGAPIEEICCDVRGAQADLTVLDVLARLALLARRSGVTISFDGLGPELLALIELAGLTDLLASPPVPRSHPGVQADRRGGRSAGSQGRT
jgi:ABC-type transporter Mla MlaB component